MRAKRAFHVAIVIAVMLALLPGCRSRGWHYRTADRMAQCLIDEKSYAVPEGISVDLSLVPHPESRLAQGGCLACPNLPQNPVQLYSYQLPQNQTNDNLLDAESSSVEAPGIVGAPIPVEAWQSIPKSCLERMFDFERIREEAEFTKKQLNVDSIIESTGTEAPKLSLEDIVDLALINSRDYQTQKETLYLVSLQLAQERFAFTTKFSANRNGAALDYSNIRSRGTSLEQLQLPSNLQIDRALVTGGDLLASFANNILLTFDGPSGFTADIGSSILIDFVQPLIQVDIQFESLTQAERNLVYAARDFARFRKSFFVDFAQSYYDLIASFRQIEIDSQNYFSLVRAFNQAEAEFSAGLVPRVQVDQVEQSLLSGRGRLIGTCNAVEQSLDQLKLALGLPTETPINIDLDELNELTRLDQASVSANSTNRVLRRLTSAMKNPDRAELASTAAVLLDRLIDTRELDNGVAKDDPETQRLKRLRARYLIDYNRINADRILTELDKEVRSESPSVPVIFQRSIASCNGLLKLITSQIEFADLELDDVDSAIARFRSEAEEQAEELQGLRDGLRQLIEKNSSVELPDLIEQSRDIQNRLKAIVAALDEQLELQPGKTTAEDLERIRDSIAELLETAESELLGSEKGLQPIEIDMDDAMITALVLRYELMNQRGVVADDWRQIKLAADELKSVLTFQASHQVNTNPDANQPFNFDLDDSVTSLGLTFDSPLNRFAQRNAFRSSIIGYQRSLRNLQLLEDNIKFSVRNDLRNLQLDREQYLIAVASAALAYERVVSTSLEFRLGTGGVTARDFLESQTAYIDALSSVANRHIRYIVNRTQLFFNLELLMVDEDGFWNDIRNEELQPEPQFEIPPWGQPVFGDLPDVRYSSVVRQILCPVNSTLYGTPSNSIPADADISADSAER